MIYTWFKIFNRTEFEALGFISKTYTFFLEGIGEKDILVTKGNLLGITYEGVFLSLLMNDQNPFKMDGLAVYVNTTTNDVYLGVEVES